MDQTSNKLVFWFYGPQLYGFDSLSPLSSASFPPGKYFQ